MLDDVHSLSSIDVVYLQVPMYMGTHVMGVKLIMINYTQGMLEKNSVARHV